MALSIDIAANTKQAQAQVKDLGETLEDVGDTLDDVARDGKQAGDKLERSFKDLAKEAKKADNAIEDIGDGGKKGFNKAGEASGEFRSEALQNLSEVSSSFTGDIQSIGDLAQGTFGGLASSLPGILGLAGAGAAAGIGLITSAFVAADERRQELEQRANDLASAYIDAGTNVLDAMAVANASADILTDQEKRKEAQAYADALGVDLPTAIRAYVGDSNAMAVIDKIATDAKRENRDIADAQRESLKALTPEQQKQLEANQKAIAAQRELTGIVDGANTTFETQQSILRGLINDADGATKQVDDLGNELYTLPDGVQVMIDAETGQATTDVSKFKQDAASIPTEVTSTVKVAIDTSAWDRWNPTIKQGRVAVGQGGAGGLTWQ